MIRGGILASSAAVALIVTGAFGLAADVHAQATKRAAPLELKDDASARPWKRYNGWPARDESKWNTLANLAAPPAPTAARKLTGPITGDAANGARLVADRNRGGSCLACHVMGQAGNADLPGNAAPDLSEIGNAGRTDEWLFNYIFDARVYNPDTVMPPWGGHGVFNDQEINDMVAFLKTLKKPAVFKTVLDDPNKRPAPVEKRENLDPIENPGMWAVDKAQELWKLKSSIGFSCNTCHSDPKETFKTWAASMPKWEPRLNKVLGVEEFVTRHAKATTGATWLMETAQCRSTCTFSPTAHRSRSTPAARKRRRRSSAARNWRRASWANSTLPAPIATANRPITGSAGNGWASRKASTTTSRPGAPACWQFGISASASSGARSTSAPTSFRPTPRNTAIWSSIWRRRMTA